MCHCSAVVAVVSLKEYFCNHFKNTVENVSDSFLLLRSCYHTRGWRDDGEITNVHGSFFLLCRC